MLFVVNNQQCYVTSYCFCRYTVLLVLVNVYSYFKVEQPPLKEVELDLSELSVPA